MSLGRVLPVLVGSILAGAAVSGSSTPAKSSYSRGSASKTSFLDRTLDQNIKKGFEGMGRYAQQSVMENMKNYGQTNVAPKRISVAGKVGGTPSFTAQKVNLVVPGSTNQKVLNKYGSAMQNKIFQQIMTNALRNSPRLGRTINLASNKIDVKSRINPETVKI